MKQILEQINKKEQELSQLKQQYNVDIEIEKNKVLKSKLKGISKSLYLLNFEFESSCGRTEQYLEFHGVFKKEFKELLKSYIKEIDISKPNHFDVSGFFKLNNDEIYWFCIGDLRWNKNSLLIRMAKDFKDYTGGINNYIKLDENFTDNLFRYLKLKELI